MLSRDQFFIKKLNGILEANYHDEHFGVGELALAAGISRSQLHRKINRIKGVSVSQFIKLYRLEKAYHLLEADAASISEIAFSVGFSSVSYFSKCFHEQYNCAPGELRMKMTGPVNALNTEKIPVNEGSARLGKNFGYGLLGLFIIVISIVLFIDSTVNRDKIKPISIGVLPFKNLTEDPANQYFADGVMDVIMSSLSKIEHFEVISRTTMEQYRETTKTVPEIARKLNISHILESSVQKYDNKVRIVLQLIDAKNDIHLWSKDIERPYNDIFQLQSDIAKEVVHQLKLELSTADMRKMEKEPAKNIEAYNLYLKGRFFWHRRNKESLEKSIYYFEEALKFDPEYAEAYAGLADAYLIMTWWKWIDKKEGFKNAKIFAHKALTIDPDLTQAHATLGGILTWSDRDWAKAESELQQAISLDPQYATAHQYYAELLDIMGRNEEARNEIELALKYNPNSSVMNAVGSTIYFNNQDYHKALDAIQKCVEISGVKWHMMIVLANFKLGEDEMACRHLIDGLMLLPGFVRNDAEIERIWDESGIKGIVRYYIDQRLKLENDEFSHFYTPLYCILGETQLALECFEKSFNAGEINVISQINDLSVECIRDEPPFRSIREKLNL